MSHKHSFSVDAACGGCGIMLSELVATLILERDSYARKGTELKREREEDQKAIRAQHTSILMLLQEFAGDVTGAYSSPASRRMQADIKKHATAIFRATDREGAR